MRKNKSIIILMLVLLLMLPACASNNKKSSESDGMRNPDSNYEVKPSEAYPGEYGYENDGMDMETEPKEDSKPKEGSNEILLSSDRLLIINGELEIETRDFENSSKVLIENVEKMGGYVSGLNEYYDTIWGSNNEKIKAARFTYIVRIPYDKTNEFISAIGDVGSVVRKNLDTEDVSLRYAETERRLKLYDDKISRLEKLLEQATKMEDILLIQSEIENAIEKKEILAGDFKQLQDLVSLSTITIYLNEVKEYSQSVEVKDSFGTRIAAAFSYSLTNFKYFLEDFLISLIYILPILIFFALIIFLIIKLIRKIRNKRSKKLFNKNIFKKDNKTKDNKDETKTE
ncbi:MAG: DUF4349 domain-containing protein [Tissierellia bacterium]|nr:DUF4349 domain-containing protein [Tissierellia bacterium]